MSGFFYWETSTLLKLYAVEPDSPAYRSLMKGRRERPVTSFLHRAELFYSLRHKEERREIVDGAAARLFSLSRFSVNVPSGASGQAKAGEIRCS